MEETRRNFSDLELLSLLTKKATFNRITPYIKEYVITPEALTVIKNVALFYTENPSKDELDWGTFKHFMLTTHNGHFKKEETELYAKLLERLHKKEYDESLADGILTHYIEKDYATKIANAADEVARGSEEHTIDDIEELVASFKKDVGSALTSVDLFECPTQAESANRSTPGLEWPLEELNVSLGPIRQGDFIIVGATPETGKTTLVSWCVGYMAQQDKTDRPVVWIRNEEGAAKIGNRVRQSVLGLTQVQIEMLGTKANEEYTKLIPERKILILKDDSGANDVRKLNRIFAELNPMLVVMDVLDKITIHGRYDRDDLRLGALYKWARDTAIQYCPVIATSQVSGEGAGQKWLTQEMLRGSKTDKAAEADGIILMGRVNEPTQEHDRFIHIPKNKLVGGVRSQETYRHGHFEVKIRPEIARFEGSM